MSVDYELGYDSDDDAVADLGVEFRASSVGLPPNREDVEAIDRYIGGLAPTVERMRAERKLTAAQLRTWDEYWKKWHEWYAPVKASWIVTGNDVKVARGIRDQINAALKPAAFKHVKATAASQAPAASKKEIEQAVEDAKRPFPWKEAIVVGTAVITGLYLFGGVIAAKALRVVAKVA